MIGIEETIKSSKKILGEKISCSVEVLTPLHVGSGVKLAKGIDFISSNDSVKIISQAELLKYLEDNSDELEKFIQNGYKLDNINLSALGKRYPINGERIFDISEFERNGNGKPYIPGSSIKGAIRTIIIKNKFDKLSLNDKNSVLNSVTSKDKEWASEPIVKKLLGDTSNQNLMRVLEVFDAEFDEITLEKVLILSLSNNAATEYKWKKVGKDTQNQDNPKYATSFFIEALPIGAKGFTSILLNNFLYNNSTAQQQLNFTEQSLSNINSLVQAINDYSVKNLMREKDFFTKLNSNKRLYEIIKNIDSLISQAHKLQKNEMILRLSWGSGWKGMTGDFLEESWINIFRDKYSKNNQMGKNGFPIFPKTRRIVFDDDTPKYQPGWVKIKLNDVEKNTFSDINKHQKENYQNKVDPNDWEAKLSHFTKQKNIKKKK